MVQSNLWQIVAPHVGPQWNIQQHIESLGDVQVPYLLVDNSPHSDTKDMAVPNMIERVYYPQNAGIAASWNMGLAKGKKWTLVLSVSTRFRNGLMSWLEEAEHWCNDFGLTTPIGFHCQVIGKHLIDMTGDFDPNLWPGYMEDTTWYYVRDRIPQYNKHTMPMFRSDDVYFIADAVAVRSGAVPDQCATQREAYYISKWGGLPGHECYQHPFNDPTKDHKYYPPLNKIGRPDFYG